MKYLVVIEETRSGFSAFSPDVDGCVATGSTRMDVERRMKGALELHLQGIREDGGQPPRPRSYSTYLDLPA
jgi:predicted RNase H-like HicB family nuclease